MTFSFDILGSLGGNLIRGVTLSTASLAWEPLRNTSKGNQRNVSYLASPVAPSMRQFITSESFHPVALHSHFNREIIHAEGRGEEPVLALFGSTSRKKQSLFHMAIYPRVSPVWLCGCVLHCEAVRSVLTDCCRPSLRRRYSETSWLVCEILFLWCGTTR